MDLLSRSPWLQIAASGAQPKAYLEYAGLDPFMVYLYIYELDYGDHKDLRTVESYASDERETIDGIRSIIEKEASMVQKKSVPVRYLGRSSLYRRIGTTMFSIA